MESMGADRNLMSWTESFILVIDSYELKKAGVETRVLQGSSVSAILFAIHLSGVIW